MHLSLCFFLRSDKITYKIANKEKCRLTVIAMAYIKGVLLEERERLLKERDYYKNELGRCLPTGTIVKKRINGHQYHYFQFRDKSHVRSIYIKASDLESYQKKIDERDETRKILRDIEENLELIDNALRRKQYGKPEGRIR